MTSMRPRLKELNDNPYINLLAYIYFYEISENQLGILMLRATSTKFLECFLAVRAIN